MNVNGLSVAVTIEYYMKNGMAHGLMFENPLIKDKTRREMYFALQSEYDQPEP